MQNGKEAQMSNFRRRIMMIAGDLWFKVSAWFHSIGWFRSEAW